MHSLLRQNRNRKIVIGMRQGALRGMLGVLLLLPLFCVALDEACTTRRPVHSSKPSGSRSGSGCVPAPPLPPPSSPHLPSAVHSFRSPTLRTLRTRAHFLAGHDLEAVDIEARSVRRYTRIAEERGEERGGRLRADGWFWRPHSRAVADAASLVVQRCVSARSSPITTTNTTATRSATSSAESSATTTATRIKADLKAKERTLTGNETDLDIDLIAMRACLDSTFTEIEETEAETEAETVEETVKETTGAATRETMNAANEAEEVEAGEAAEGTAGEKDGEEEGIAGEGVKSTIKPIKRSVGRTVRALTDALAREVERDLGPGVRYVTLHSCTPCIQRLHGLSKPINYVLITCAPCIRPYTAHTAYVTAYTV